MTATDLTEVDLIRIRHLVEDHAGSYYGGPLSLGRDDTIRYTVDTVDNLFPDVDYNTLRGLVIEAIDDQPNILDRRLTEADREKRAAVRRDAANGWLDLAHRLITATRHDPLPTEFTGLDVDDRHALAAACVDVAEREDPTHPSVRIARDIVARRWRRGQVDAVTGRAMRLVHAGSRTAALAWLDEAAAEFPDVDWDRVRHRVQVYPAEPEN